MIQEQNTISDNELGSISFDTIYPERSRSRSSSTQTDKELLKSSQTNYCEHWFFSCCIFFWLME